MKACVRQCSCSCCSVFICCIVKKIHCSCLTYWNICWCCWNLSMIVSWTNNERIRFTHYITKNSIWIFRSDLDTAIKLNIPNRGGIHPKLEVLSPYSMYLMYRWSMYRWSSLGPTTDAVAPLSPNTGLAPFGYEQAE